MYPNFIKEKFLLAIFLKKIKQRRKQILFQKLIFFAKIAFMRVDKFLNVVNITKRRAISEDMCKSGVVGINGVIVKASKEVKVGDIITLHFTEYTQKYKVLALPSTKSIPKKRTK